MDSHPLHVSFARIHTRYALRIRVAPRLRLGFTLFVLRTVPTVPLPLHARPSQEIAADLRSEPDEGGAEQPVRRHAAPSAFGAHASQCVCASERQAAQNEGAGRGQAQEADRVGVRRAGAAKQRAFVRGAAAALKLKVMEVNVYGAQG